MPENSPQYTIVSQGNEFPPVVVLTPADIPAPVYDPNDYGWYVENHDAEPYEAMRVAVLGVTVTTMDLGKAGDNYDLQGGSGASCWASDYVNVDRDSESDYHAFVSVGAEFCIVSGVLEQYTKLSTGWDYYQVLTGSSADIVFCGDADHDGDVDLSDLGVLLAAYNASEARSRTMTPTPTLISAGASISPIWVPCWRTTISDVISRRPE